MEEAGTDDPMDEKPPISLGYIAEYLEADLQGDPDIAVSRLAPIEKAKDGEITFLSDPKKAHFLETTKASALIVPEDVSIPGKTLLKVKNPYVAFARVQALFHPGPQSTGGISPQAHIEDLVSLGTRVTIHPFAYIGKGARIGEGSIVYPHVYVGEEVAIGQNCILYPGVRIYARCRLGDRVILHSGVVIGADGFGYAWDGTNHVKIPQVGRVVIGNDVEIGANSTVDRGTLEDTIIGNDVKIDNLVQIGHNVKVGDHSILVSQVGIAGSTEIGQGVILAGQVGVAGHLKIGNGVKVAAQSGIHKNIRDGEVISGSPPMPFKVWVKMAATLPRLPEMRRKIKKLEDELRKIEKRLKNTSPEDAHD